MPNAFRTASYDTLTLNGLSIDDALDELTGGESAASEATRTHKRWLQEATTSTFTMRAGSAFRRGWPK